MDDKTKKLNDEFHKWWEEKGYKYYPENEEEADWLIVVRYWAWKSWEASNQLIDSGTKYSGNPDNNPRKDVDIFHAPIL